jgi:nucleoside-diphosphate-sugar epimerase
LEPDHFSGIDALVHFAAHSANAPYDSLDRCLHWNVTVPLRMAAKAWEGGVRRFIVAGSCFEYGRSGERFEYIPVSAPLEPTQSYPISKAAASVAWSGFCRERCVSVSILRIFQVFGEGESGGRLWPTLRKNALAGNDHLMTAGEQVRDFIEVEEVARQFLTATVAAVEPGVPYIKNIGTGCPQTVRGFSEHWWRKWKAPGRLKFGALPYRHNEVMRYIPEIDNG